jgi:glycosyltransferase involved in cell wall biosynthesis
MTRVLRIISRLNVGGPAIQALTLTQRLEPLGYETTLIRGAEAPREGNMDRLADELGVRPRRVGSLRRELGPRDLRALIEITAAVRRVRPDVLHTHTAKAGTIGRLAAMLAGDAAPAVRVHTFHGHVLTGYFSARKERLYTAIERGLAGSTTRLIAVSDQVRHDLLGLGVAPPTKIETVPLGFDLAPFQVDPVEHDRRRAAVRDGLGIAADALVVTLVARLVPIKRVDRFLRVAAKLRDLDGVRFLIVGDGELATELEASDSARLMADRLVWAGLRGDMPAVMSASDVVALTSDNEGTPVSLIEAQAAGVPVVGTNVGGVADAVADGRTGVLVPVDDEDAFAEALRTVLLDRELAGRLGAAGPEHVRARFSIDRLVRDIDGLYRRLLADV